MDKDSSYAIGSGDVFCLLSTEDYKFIIKNIEENNNPLKRKREDDMDIEVVRSKKKKVCKYGEKCYRVNPAHLEEFDHPWKNIQPKLTDDISIKEEDLTNISYSKKIESDKLTFDFTKENNEDNKFVLDLSLKMDIDNDKIPESNGIENIQSKKNINYLSKNYIKKEETKIIKKVQTKIPLIKIHEEQSNENDNLNDMSINLDLIGSLSIAIPVLGTNGSNIDPEIAVEAALKNASSFLQKYNQSKIEIFFCAKDNSPCLNYFKSLKNGEDRIKLISHHEYPIIIMKSLNYPCCTIVNETNWRFNPKGSGINQLIHNKGGPSFSKKSKEKYNIAEVGNAYPIIIDTDSPLFLDGIQCVIHALPPNMNPRRPDPISSIEKVIELLNQSYTNIFTTFAQITKQKLS